VIDYSLQRRATLGQFSGRLTSWNHLTLSHVMADGVSRRPPRRQRTAEDDY
jgi:hypothetical protein